MDEAPPQEEDFSLIPVSDRLVHKNWKARVSAYSTLVKTFETTASDTDPAFKPYINNPDILKKIATDSNAVAQEKGIECLVAFIKFAGETAARTREAVIPALVEKCFGSSRAGTKAQAIELSLQYVEVENGGAGVVADILPGLSAKQPKAVAGCVSALKEIMRLFGTQTTPPPPILKVLPKIFGHTDKTVRAEGTQLSHILYRYIGPGIEPWLADLKPVQVKELKEAFEKLDGEGNGKGSLKPERLTRAQAREAEALAEAGGEGSAGDVQEEPEDLDPRQFAEPVDIASKIPSSFSTMITSSKWKERKEVLDELLVTLNSVSRIKDAPAFGDLVKSLAARIQSDANVNCVMVAANCLEAMARGMMSAFARYREAAVPPIIERLKERKASVTDTLGTTLDAIFSATSISDILPDLQAAWTHKNPQVKEGTLKFLGRCLANASSPIQTAQIKPLAESLTILLEDSYAGARDEAAVCLGTLMKMVGERPLVAIIDGLADVRKAKIKDAFKQATVKCKAGGSAPAPRSAAPPPASATVSAPPKKKTPPKPSAPTVTDENDPPPPAKPSAKPPARLMPKKSPSAPPAQAPPAVAPAKKAVSSAAAPKSAKPSTPAAPGALDTFKYKYSPEDAESLAAEAIPSSILTDFGDTNWKTRLAALEEMTTWLGGAVGSVESEVVIRVLAKKGWSEKNFQVSSKLYGILVLLAEQSPSFGRSSVALSVPHLSEKLGDMKLKKPAGDALTVFAEKTSLQFVLNQAYDPLSKQKAPKVLADAITWVNSAITEFGISGLTLRNLIDFLKTGLQNSNATVRTSATKALVTLRIFAGSGIKDLLEDLNPQLLNTITTEFDKAEGTPAPEPVRVGADLRNMAASASHGKGVSAGHDALDDLFPRVEIDSLFKGTTVLADAKSDSWKTKKEALETLQSLLDQGNNKRLKPSMGEIGQILKTRVTDTNKAVQNLALDIVARIATGMGKPFEKHVRLFVVPVATVLADQKAPIRTAALQVLTSIATACEGLDAMIPGVATALESSNPLQKGTLLHWMADWLITHETPPSLDLSPWAGPVVAALDDRNADVRKGSHAMLPIVITYAGFDYVMQQANSLKPASRSSAVPLIQAARPSNAPAVPPSQYTKTVVKSPVVKYAPAAPSPPDSPPPTQPAKTISKSNGIRKKLPQGNTRPETPVDVPSRITKAPGTGLKRPGASAIASKAPPARTMTPLSNFVLSGTNIEARKNRLNRDASRWINESGPTRKDLADLLQTQMEAHASKELMSHLFSIDHNAVADHISGMCSLCELYDSAQDGNETQIDICLANFDLPLKFVSIKAHEPQPNLISKCLDLVNSVLSLLRSINHQMTDNEALCFVPTLIYKLGDAREQVRTRVQQIIQSLSKVYPYSRVFQLLLDHGLKSKVAKTRQGALDEMAVILRKSGIAACDPPKAFPFVGSMISDKDSSVRKAALGVLSEAFSIIGEKVWTFVGPIPPKDKTQLEERLRRVAGPSTRTADVLPAPQVSRLVAGIPRPASPAAYSKIGGIQGIPRSASPAASMQSKTVRPSSPAHPVRAASPTTLLPTTNFQPASMSKATPMSPTGIGRPKTMMPSRLARPRSNFPQPSSAISQQEATHPTQHANVHSPSLSIVPDPDDITITISSILSSDPNRSVDSLKRIQRILSVGPDAGPSSDQYRELAEHTEGLVETITLQVAHIFERSEDLLVEENFRLAKHLIQTLNNFCDHSYLAESLTITILTSLLEELTLRLLQTDNSPVKQIKDLSRFINMIILRLFATGRRMSIFKSLFNLLLQIVKPFPVNGTSSSSQESKIAELVLKCIWKLARNMPQDLTEQKLDPVELFPAIEGFLQSVPPNEWRARATNKVPCGDMPLRTIKVIIQHVVAHYGDDVYDILSAAFDDPSATIVYPYVYRILNSATRAAVAAADVQSRPESLHGDHEARPVSPASSRPISPHETVASSTTSLHHPESVPSHRTSPSSSSANGHFGGRNFPPMTEEPDPDAQLLTIIGHISSETTGALHKEGITELHQFLKAYPHKRPKVEKMLESTGAAFRKYINRALATRAAEDQERNVAVADTLSKLESNGRVPTIPSTYNDVDTAPTPPKSPRRISTEPKDAQDKLSRLHDIFQYRSSTLSNGSQDRAPRTSLS